MRRSSRLQMRQQDGGYIQPGVGHTEPSAKFQIQGALDQPLASIAQRGGAALLQPAHCGSSDRLSSSPASLSSSALGGRSGHHTRLRRA